MKKDLENLERFVEFIRLTAHQLVSAQPTGKECPHNSHPNPTLTGGPPDNTQLYV